MNDGTHVINYNGVKSHKDLKSLDSQQRELKISQNKLFVYSETRFH
jgi:hypothetical protein